MFSGAVWLVLVYGSACVVAGLTTGLWARPKLEPKGRHHYRNAHAHPGESAPFSPTQPRPPGGISAVTGRARGS
jgi:hypothetical protein